MRHPINKDRVLKLLNQGLNPPDIAKELGVARASLYRVIKGLKSHAPKVVVLEKADKYVDYQMNMMEQYNATMKSNVRLREGLTKYIYDGDRTVFAEMQERTEVKSVEQGAGDVDVGSKKKSKGSGKKSKIEQKINRFDFSVDPHLLLVQVNRAIKELLSLQVEVFKACGDTATMISILNRIIEAMGKVAPETKYAIEEILKRDQLIRSVITFNSSDQTDLRS